MHRRLNWRAPLRLSCQEKTVFRTDSKQETAQGSDAYFLTSADRVHFFLEPGATDEATGDLTVPKQRALNKVRKI
jgi:hypothetical protein